MHIACRFTFFYNIQQIQIPLVPYRRFPKTDTARLKSLGILLDNNDVYVAERRFLDMAKINAAKLLYDKLKTLSSQFLLAYEAQMKNYQLIAKPQKNMMMFINHFMRVLCMSIERGEIKYSAIAEYYGVDDIDETMRQLHNVDYAYVQTPEIVRGEKQRVAAGGRPIYNPTIGMVATHYDIFKDVYEQQKILNAKSERALAELKALREEVDGLLVDVWNQVEAHFADVPPEQRFDECRRYGLIYYYRKGEKKPE